MDKLFALFKETSGVSTDTRNIDEDCMFIALKGSTLRETRRSKLGYGRGGSRPVAGGTTTVMLLSGFPPLLCFPVLWRKNTVVLSSTVEKKTVMLPLASLVLSSTVKKNTIMLSSTVEKTTVMLSTTVEKNTIMLTASLVLSSTAVHCGENHS